MPRGRKKRVLQCHPPPKGYYTVDWVVNDLVSLNALSGPGLSLWLHLKGLAWERGECDPTDECLAELMGGVTAEMVRITRRELRGLHLLLEYRKPAASARWLIPLPVLAGLRGSLPAEIIEEVTLGEAQLRPALAQLRTQGATPHPGSNGNLPQAGFGANPAGGEIAAAAADVDTERAELTAFLVEHSIFASVAGNLVEWMLAHKTVAEAKVYALAHLRAVQEGENSRGQRLQGEQAIGRWVARLREHARAPEWALAQAARELETGDGADEEALDEEDAEADNELPDEDETEGPASSDGAEAAVEEIACIPLNGQLATPSAVWQAAQTAPKLGGVAQSGSIPEHKKALQAPLGQPSVKNPGVRM